MFRHVACLVLGAVFVLGLTSCGGGGGDDGPAPEPEPKPTWAVSSSSTGNCWSVDVAEAPDGSIAVAGGFEGIANFAENTTGAATLNGVDSSDSYVARFDVEGTLLWVQRMAGIDFTDVRGLDIGPDGAVYVAGLIYNSITFAAGTPQEISFVSDDGGDGFVACYEAAGVLRWARQVDGTGIEELHDVAAMPDGGVIVAGLYFDEITLGAGEVTETTLTPTGFVEAMVASFAPDGKLRWAKTTGSTVLTTAWSIAALTDGSIAVVGDFNGSTTWGTGETNETTVASTAPDPGETEPLDIYVARYDINGNLTWVRTIGGGKSDEVNRVLEAPGGALRVTGTFAGVATFGGEGLAPVALTSEGAQDGFIASYDAAGDLDWVDAIGGIDTDQCFDTRVLPNGKTVVVGFFTGEAVVGAGTFAETTLLADSPTDQEAYIAGYDAAGFLEFATAFGGAGNDAAIGLMPVSDGTWIVTGQFTQTFLIDGVTALTGGPTNTSAFFARVDEQGGFEDPAP